MASLAADDRRCGSAIGVRGRSLPRRQARRRPADRSRAECRPPAHAPSRHGRHEGELLRRHVIALRSGERRVAIRLAHVALCLARSGAPSGSKRGPGSGESASTAACASGSCANACAAPASARSPRPADRSRDGHARRAAHRKPAARRALHRRARRAGSRRSPARSPSASRAGWPSASGRPLSRLGLLPRSASRQPSSLQSIRACTRDTVFAASGSTIVLSGPRPIVPPAAPKRHASGASGALP